MAFCVGSIDLKPIKFTKKSDYMQSFNLNLISATEIIRASHEKLKSNKGSIVMFSTVAARKGFMNHSIIGSAKAAVEGLTVSLAAELAPKIRVNAIAPSLLTTPLSTKFLNTEEKIEANKERHPMKEIGDPNDIATLVEFLINDGAKWMTGQVINFDGGLSTL